MRGAVEGDPCARPARARRDHRHPQARQLAEHAANGLASRRPPAGSGQPWRARCRHTRCAIVPASAVRSVGPGARVRSRRGLRRKTDSCPSTYARTSRRYCAVACSSTTSCAWCASTVTPSAKPGSEYDFRPEKKAYTAPGFAGVQSAPNVAVARPPPARHTHYPANPKRDLNFQCK